MILKKGTIYADDFGKGCYIVWRASSSDFRHIFYIGVYIESHMVSYLYKDQINQPLHCDKSSFEELKDEIAIDLYLRLESLL